jgi:hypothetical protein
MVFLPSLSQERMTRHNDEVMLYCVSLQQFIAWIWPLAAFKCNTCRLRAVSRRLTTYVRRAHPSGPCQAR